MEKYIKYGIMGAMDVEIEKITRAMSDVRTEIVGMSEFNIGRIGSAEIVAVQSGIGKVNASLVASVLILRYGVDAVLMTGVAGSVSCDLKPLDAFVPTAFVQHDVTMIGCEDGFIDIVGVVEIPADKALSDALARSCDGKCGLMATGEQFVGSKEQSDKILKSYPKTKGVDMESGAVAQVCTRFGKPFACIKVISDGGNESDYYDFKTVASDKATSAVLSLLK